MAATPRRIGIVLLILGVLFGATEIGPGLDECTTALSVGHRQELSDFVTPAAEHTVGVALPLPAVAVASRYRIDSIVWNRCDYDALVPHLRGPPPA